MTDPDGSENRGNVRMAEITSGESLACGIVSNLDGESKERRSIGRYLAYRGVIAFGGSKFLVNI
jgi:hypothetical protein